MELSSKIEPSAARCRQSDTWTLAGYRHSHFFLVTHRQTNHSATTAARSTFTGQLSLIFIVILFDDA